MSVVVAYVGLVRTGGESAEVGHINLALSQIWLAGLLFRPGFRNKDWVDDIKFGPSFTSPVMQLYIHSVTHTWYMPTHSVYPCFFPSASKWRVFPWLSVPTGSSHWVFQLNIPLVPSIDSVGTNSVPMVVTSTLDSSHLRSLENQYRESHMILVRMYYKWRRYLIICGEWASPLTGSQRQVYSHCCSTRSGPENFLLVECKWRGRDKLTLFGRKCSILSQRYF